MTEYRFIEPLDVLYLRGNLLFEGAGAHATSQMPPWPSAAAGSIRTRMLADAGANMQSFARGEPLAPENPLAEILGTPKQPGTFQLSAFLLARAADNVVEPHFPLPADVVVTREDLSDAAYLLPVEPHACIRTGSPFRQLPVATNPSPAKPIASLWLNAAGLEAYLRGRQIEADHLLPATGLWQTDPRLGIALDPATGSTIEGLLYTSETVATRPGVGFLVGVAGADDAVPHDGALRFGGDGRGAAISACDVRWPEPDWSRIGQQGRFRIVTASPGLFDGGWRLPGMASDGQWTGPGGMKGRVVTACVDRSQTVSGWDLARRAPKPALRSVAVGSTYFIEASSIDVDALRKLAGEGLWPLIPENERDAARRAEGFNNVFIAEWPGDQQA